MPNFGHVALRHGCSPVNLLHIFRTPFLFCVVLGKFCLLWFVFGQFKSYFESYFVALPCFGLFWVLLDKLSSPFGSFWLALARFVLSCFGLLWVVLG